MFAYNEPLSSYKLYHETPVESKIFERLFPKIPLVGALASLEKLLLLPDSVMKWAQCVRRAGFSAYARS